MTDNSKQIVYLSYAHADDQPFGGSHARWVQDFRNALETLIHQYSGERVSLWMDSRNIDPSQSLTDQHRKVIGDAGAMVSIVSPAYFRSKWCTNELQEYLALSAQRRPGQPPNWFKVLKYPVGFGDLPPDLPDTTGYQFFSTEETGHIRQWYMDLLRDGDVSFWQRISELAQDISKALRMERWGLEGRRQSVPTHDRTILVRESDETERKLKVFLCHSSADKQRVRELYSRLLTAGTEPWLDEKSLIPGQRWEIEIPNAVRNSDVAIVCVSKASVAKRGYLQKELAFALDIALQEPEGSIYLIPARLEECDLPSRLGEYQWVNLYDEDGFTRLLAALHAKAGSLTVAANSAPAPR